MTRFLKGFQFGTPHRKGSQFGTPLQEGVSIWHPLYEQGVSIWHPFTSRGSNLAPLVGPNDTQVTRIDTHPVPSFFPESSLQVEARISLDTRPVGNNHLFGQQDHSRFLFFFETRMSKRILILFVWFPVSSVRRHWSHLPFFFKCF